MEDREKKIITLTHEMIRANMVLGPRPAAASIAMSFWTLCLVTLLSAAGGSAVTEWQAESQCPINRYEKTELNALVYYAAREKQLDEQALQQDVLARVGVSAFDDMNERQFLAARHYLQDKVQ